ncbi:hypothetical protein [Pseudomonas oryzicola]|uniref:Uncharacterized protein n=1 Tax=Pseudomonas oryzicola TaxID=485876 RepID=A0ABS6QGY2_9PSED|nr:hypothetical protein [Pseudomonas oryzicola]MBV4493376.1 hypothetical protein [Pseudomonas oryzicola]
MKDPDFFERTQQLSRECLKAYSAVRVYLMDKPLSIHDPLPDEYQELITRSREAISRYLSFSRIQGSKPE